MVALKSSVFWDIMPYSNLKHWLSLDYTVFTFQKIQLFSSNIIREVTDLGIMDAYTAFPYICT
jgi:hypothetical protein